MSASFIVLGCHRTRTSMVAHMLNSMGVNMGDELLGAGQFNRWGHWEDVYFYQLNREILFQAGGHWAKPPEEHKVLEAAKWMTDEMKQLTAWNNKRYGKWGFKDPRTILTIRRWELFLPDPHYVITRRPKEDVVNSLERRAEGGGAGSTFDYTRNDWADLYDDYDSRLREFLEENECPAIGVDTDLFMSRSTAPSECARLADFVGGNARAAYEAIRFRD